MLHLYYSNHLEIQKEILISLMLQSPLADPFHSEQVLVQSQGMAQWLKLQIAEKCGVAANIDFPLPAGFIWQQYHRTLSDVPEQNAFQKEALQWHLTALIPTLLTQADFAPLKKYLGEPPSQEKLYQLAGKIADLFDQYLVYRPDWIQAWQQQNEQAVLQSLFDGKQQDMSDLLHQELQGAVAWQGKLWRAVYARIERQAGQRGSICRHRAALHHEYLQKLAAHKPHHLPQRLFIFGISALPAVYLQTFQAIAQHCEVHLFFNNPCRYYWGDIVDNAFLRKLQLRQRLKHQQGGVGSWLNERQQAAFPDDGRSASLQSGNPLLAAWGKMGRDFLYLLSQSEANEIDAYADVSGQSLLAQLQNAILDLQPAQPQAPFLLHTDDDSIRIHACHSPMREVEVLHDQLLHLFERQADLTPKDIVVMVADVDKYVPYIHAVFAQYDYQDPRFIPYEITDRKHTHSDVIISTFLNLLQLKESTFSAESVLGLLDVPELRACFALDLNESAILKNWVAENGIRYGLSRDENDIEPNYNAWQSGLERMLLGSAMRQADGIWQQTVAFDSSYGLNAQIVGKLGEFLQRLQDWQRILQQSHDVAQWQQHLHWVLAHFFAESEQSRYALLFLSQRIDDVCRLALETEFDGKLNSNVVFEWLNGHLSEEDGGIHFLNGKLSFCTLLPMRAIPFKVVALLGMNEGDYPRQQAPNSFDLMQYSVQKGDRVRRDDDRYLFLEAILSAQQTLYISYVGRSLTDNQQLQPSVLVSQLLDYLADQSRTTDGGDVRQQLVRQYPMTVFSRDNFEYRNPNRSFAREWLVAATGQSAVSDFIQPLGGEPFSRPVIEFDSLRRFVVDPVRYFFEKQLGVYLRQHNDEIEDSEVFQISPLARYQLSDALLRQPVTDWSQQFEFFKLKGELPRAHFATISQHEISERLQSLSKVIAPYLSQTAESMPIAQDIVCGQQTYRLQGEIDRLYQGRRIEWRSGAVKPNHQIETWLYYLVQTAQLRQTAPTPHFYGLDGETVQCCRFNDMSLEDAERQLAHYIADFVESERQLLVLPTALYPLFCGDSAKTAEELLNEIWKLAEETPYQSADPYWQRLLSQHQSLNLAVITAKMQQWFGLMAQSLLDGKENNA
ncbi:hypothetical protein OA57_08845 [Chelonobacter oris]|uniref:RecBCD enzyme subunit RecC n=1 Tax=Chelonobacter oris TaxID=505317 RepID=A0A0A3AK38_9PAST|nr:exodeoxyribonuclease V subunit gamma [Chelonobacter oris]KGQ69743.1 hypothetical protein OA57_08845 [Chelonobacter oris]